MQPVDEVFTPVAPGSVDDAAMSAPPDSNSSGWKHLKKGQRWGAKPGTDLSAPIDLIDWGMPVNGGSTHWLRTTVQVTKEWQGKSVFLALTWEGKGQASM